MKNRISSLAFLLVFILMLAGCGNNSNNAAESANPESAGSASPEASSSAGTGSSGEGALAAVKQKGSLQIGTEGTYAPFSFHDTSGTLTGFDVDIANEVAKRLGVKAEFVETQWDGMVAGLDAKRFDVIFNEVSINDERKAKYDFSTPYIASRAVLIVRSDNNDIKSFADLKGKKSGQSLTSNLTQIAKDNGAEIVAVDGFNQAVDLLNSKRIDATINDKLSYLDLKTQKPDIALKVVDEEANASQSAAMFRKGESDLVDAVNQALADMQKDGTYLSISKKYFGEDVSK
ncbi:amino acid ABC transporter substrate-binding protein [Paenibacillus pinistramenti]|uniref:amino acid ABC transporter substrate-binding protein n=1 Tax=Paenibacillus pinistramenti TaxID=1768003 RepID=UPI001108498F|nr:amino acid ABC transporter substrate-binding protein [Paenibacillus pinistramenti]